MHLVNVPRWIHIISGISWFGEVLTLNVVLVPALQRLAKRERILLMKNAFPRVFRLASVLSATTVLSGILMNYLMTNGWKNLTVFPVRWWVNIVVGGTLGLLLTLFHFFMETRLEPIVTDPDAADSADVDRSLHRLKVIPRTGMAILLIIVLMMMIAPRGI